MHVSALKTDLVDLPFRLSFGHNLAKRSQSTNVFVKVLLQKDSVEYAGLGESAPRDYVSGETAQSCWRYLNDTILPNMRGFSFDTIEQLAGAIEALWNARDLDRKPHGASFCAFEIALLDAFCRSQNIPFYQLPSMLAVALPNIFRPGQTVFTPRPGGLPADHTDQLYVDYGGVVPFGNNAFLGTILNFYKAYNFGTVKLKVGSSLADNLTVVKLARQILPTTVKLRIDANCAWDLDTAQKQLESLRPYGILSIEEPLAKGDLKNLAKLKQLIPETIIVDESLTTVAEANQLIAADACGAFNVRLSKLGGLIACMKIVDLARQNNLEVHLGAQVGESGVLASAQRHFAAALGAEHYSNVEGAMNLFLLKRDITRQCLTVPFGGSARVSQAAGLGVSLSRAGQRHLGHFPTNFAAPAYALASPHELQYAVVRHR